MASKKKRKIVDGAEILEKDFVKGNLKRAQKLEEAREDLYVAGKIYKLRKEAGLTQKELADLVGTQQSDISRLEDADYNGHTWKMLQRIAAAVHCCVKVEFVPTNGQYAYVG
ncbi:helix-turn-helix domain-containing protein [archaeon]|nr:helix-turn-helix domain-containing protein [archaeon]